MSHFMFLIHGSGAYTPTWSDKHQAKLNELAKSYPELENGPDYTELVKILPIRYDQVFEELIKDWADKRKRLEDHLGDSGIQIPKALALLSGTLPADADAFFWTHVMDPLLYRGSKLTRDRVRATVIDQVLKGMKDALAADGDAEFSFLSQSLGTIVTHDVLAHIGAGGEDEDGENTWKAGAFKRIKNVFKVANASRLGPSELVDPSPYKTVVRPRTAPDTEAGLEPYSGRFFNFRNVWDPVPNFQRMVPPEDWGNNYVDVTVKHIHQANVHGFIHYLEHPSVHGEIFRATLPDPDAVPRRMVTARSGAFPNLKDDGCGRAVSELKDELVDLKESVSEGDLDEFVVAMLAFYRAIKSAGKECAGLDIGLDTLL